MKNYNEPLIPQNKALLPKLSVERFRVYLVIQINQHLEWNKALDYYVKQRAVFELDGGLH